MSASKIGEIGNTLGRSSPLPPTLVDKRRGRNVTESAVSFLFVLVSSTRNGSNRNRRSFDSLRFAPIAQDDSFIARVRNAWDWSPALQPVRRPALPLDGEL
jgi:hypothetical protein